MAGRARWLCLGVDGGGTSTQAVLVDLASPAEALGRGEAGCSNKNSVGWEGSLASLRAAVDAALSATGATAREVEAVCCGVSGVDTPEDAEALAAAVRPWFPRRGAPAPAPDSGTTSAPASGDAAASGAAAAAPGGDPDAAAAAAGSAAIAGCPRPLSLSICNDAVPALCSGTGGALHGCVIIAGTGTVCYGRDAAGGGEGVRAAGWGGAFLDGGSGYDLGQRALAAVARALDGRGPPTALTGAVCAACGVEGGAPGGPMGGLLRWAYQGGGGGCEGPWARVASLAECVVAAVEAGDAVAGGILDAGAAELCASADAVCRRLGLSTGAGAAELPVVLAGGLLKEGSAYAARLAALLEAHLPAVRVAYARDPAMGAAWRACQLARERPAAGAG